MTKYLIFFILFFLSLILIINYYFYFKQKSVFDEIKLPVPLYQP